MQPLHRLEYHTLQIVYKSSETKDKTKTIKIISQIILFFMRLSCQSFDYFI